MRVERALLVAALLLAGCDGDDRGEDGGRLDASVASDDGGGSGADASSRRDGSPADAGALRSDAGADGSDAGGPSASICVLGCAVSADCDSGSPAYDVDNYRCVGRACEYTGCNDDAECVATFGRSGYVCRDQGAGLRSCVQACSTPADCGSGSPAFDADNYRCDAGTCVYEGCQDDTECEGTFGAAYGCLSGLPAPVPLPIPVAERNCLRRCSAPADCATDSGAFSADNYGCVGGACVYSGCNDDAECVTSLGASTYVCE